MTELHGYSETDYPDALESGHVPVPGDTVETDPEATPAAEDTETPLFDETSKDGKPGK